MRALSVERVQLIQVAGEARAPEGVVNVLRTLPEEGSYWSLRDLWKHLPDLPIGA